MKNIWAITKKELGLYFRSPVGYVVFCIFLLIWGFFFTSAVRWFSDYILQAAQNPYYAQQLNVNQMVLAPTFQNITIFFLLLLPALTMRLFAEEKKLGTDELLFTSPVSVARSVTQRTPSIEVIHAAPSDEAPGESGSATSLAQWAPLRIR